MSTWQPLTLRDYDPNPKIDPLSKPLPFILTPKERDVAKIASLELERNRRRQNEREAMQGLAQWRGSMHRVGEALS